MKAPAPFASNGEEDTWIGRREELLRRDNGELKLARRYIDLDQTVILAQNMSNLFRGELQLFTAPRNRRADFGEPVFGRGQASTPFVMSLSNYGCGA